VARASTCRDELYTDTHVGDALAYIDRRCHLAIRVGEIARAVGLRERQLLRRFQLIRGHSVAQEITRARLRRAQDILQFTDLSVEAVARAVGFKTGRHLTRVFLEHHGVTPPVWRRGRPVPPPRDPLDLRRAKWYMETTSLSLPLIAQACGFPSQAALREAFERREGVTPGAYRARLRAARPAPGAHYPPVEIRFFGPDGSEEPPEAPPDRDEAREAPEPPA
jgi:transcriptional regulator GlxA family with amidase domain